MSDATPICPDCSVALELGAAGGPSFWSCPAGHGVGFTMTAAYGRIDADQIAHAWSAAQNADECETSCPVCHRAMVGSAFPAAGDAVTAAVCREDEMFWLAGGRLDRLPAATPAAEPSAEELHNLALVRRSFDEGIDHAIREEHAEGILDRVGDEIAQHHPQLASRLDRSLYHGDLDDLPDLEQQVAREDAGGSSEAA